jgi:hypothetical protein
MAAAKAGGVAHHRKGNQQRVVFRGDPFSFRGKAAAERHPATPTRTGIALGSADCHATLTLTYPPRLDGTHSGLGSVRRSGSHGSVPRRHRHPGDRHATSGSPPAAQLEKFVPIDPEFSESGFELLGGQVGGDD